jgi:hypothetical protein
VAMSYFAGRISNLPDWMRCRAISLWWSKS